METKYKRYKTFYRAKQTLEKMHFFLSWASTHHSFIFDSWFLCELKHKDHFFYKHVWDFPFSDYFIFFKVFFFIQKKTDSLNSKHHNSFQNQNNIKSTHAFAPTPLMFKLQKISCRYQRYLLVGAWQKLTWRWIFRLRKLLFWTSVLLIRNYVSKYLTFLYLTFLFLYLILETSTKRTQVLI